VITLLCLSAPVSLQAESAPPAASSTTALSLSNVVLYSSGVGYFQHDGEVQGQARLDLRFKTEAINDLLKSLVVQDVGGGHVSGVTYESRDPITKTLQSFAINLTGSPSQAKLLEQLRGEQIEVEAPQSITGLVLGVETKQQNLPEAKPPALLAADYVNLLTDDGLRSIALAQVQRIRILNDRLNGELKQALAVLAAGHDTQKRTVTVRFEGQGSRKVRVAYIAETPVWKTSYRLVLNDQNQPFLQAWAIVENTTDQDWRDVRLSLVSGQPLSFIMDLYQPLYAQRPVVQPELQGSIRPPVYGEAMEEQAVADSGGVVSGERKARRNMMRDMASGMAMAKADMAPAAPAAAEPLNLAQGVTAAATGKETGEVFQYVIDLPVTLPRQTSAMLPILNQTIEGQKLSIYNQAIHAKFPLNGARIKNTSGLNLMQGPVTVFDDNAYAGDARLDDVPPGQDRLIRYALDLKAEVEVQTPNDQQELVAVSIKRGLLHATRKWVEERRYQIKNRDLKAKTVLIEHPYRSEWKLAEPAQSTERARDVYRFAVNVEPNKSGILNVREEKQIQETVHLIDSGSDQIGLYLQAKQLSPRVKEALQRAVSLRDRISQTVAQRIRLEQKLKEIAQEQARIRENMAKLPQNSELYGRYVKKLDQQETDTEKLQRDLESLRNTESSQRRDLSDYLQSLDVE
jgi:hypothetical protein